MNYPRGLIRYDTQNGLAQHLSRSQLLGRMFRPRIIVYTVILALICVAVAVSISMRSPFKVDVLRDRSSLARQVEGGSIENVYRLQIMNTTESPQTYHVTADGLPGLKQAGAATLTLGPVQAEWLPMVLRIPPETASATSPGAHEIHFTVEQERTPTASALSIREKSTFLVPR